MNRITEVTKTLIIMNVVVYFVASFVLSGSINQFLVFQHPLHEGFQPIQLITHMFMHADTMHLLFNMFALYFFGPRLEALWGEKRFLFYYLFSGFGGLLLFTIFGFLDGSGGAAVGASGAVFGLLLAVGLKFPDQPLSLIFPPITLKSKHFVMIYGTLELFLGAGAFNTGIAHFGHLGGAIFGFLLIEYWTKYGSRF